MTTARPIFDADCEIEVETADLHLTHELLWTLDWAALLFSPIHAGTSARPGSGGPVVVVPGFLGSVAGLRPLTRWLARVGLAVHDPGFERNVACPDILLQALERRIAEVAAAEGPVTLIGHSLGGSLARAAAVRVPDLVDQVITLGSPLRSVKAHPAVTEIARLLARITPARHEAHDGHSHDSTCACELAEALAAPFPASVRRLSIYTRSDGVVDWRTCIEGDATVDVEVPGTHIGLVVNRSAYAAIARALADTPAVVKASATAEGGS